MSKESKFVSVYVMVVFERMEVLIHPFLKSALYSGQLYAPATLLRQTTSPYSLNRRLRGVQVRSGPFY
jgi:hypothetical protein